MQGNARTQFTVISFAVTVAAWRIAAALSVRASPLLGESPSPAEVALLLARGLMGIAFVICGVLAFYRSAHPARFIFAWYALCAGLHWGGPLGSGWLPLQTAILLFYFTVSGLLAQSLFLHLTLVYPRPWKAAMPRWVMATLYSPPVFGGILAIGVLAFGGVPSVRDISQGAFLVLHHLQSNLFGLAALVVILVRWFQASADERTRFGLGLIVLGAWGGLLPWGAALLLGQGELAGFLTLLFVLIPASFCAALLRDGRHSESR